ncbi:MAG TPA: hypothetical protein PKB02_17620 [Anaerohalosphaeraceae bacterium]|nr:hypothetical protein [Anaerohalosphaeraceae bacterium]
MNARGKPNGYDYSATAIGRSMPRVLTGYALPYAAAVIMLFLEAGG